MKIIPGGITAPEGYTAIGAHIGIKKSKRDLALVASHSDAVCAACFTTNLVKAAPVIWNIQVYGNMIRGIAVTSGNANACTGKRGMDDTRTIADTFAKKIGAVAENIIVCSTGVIGVPLPIDIIVEGINKNADFLKPEYRQISKTDAADSADTVIDSDIGADAASDAICTTDTFAKHIAVEFTLGGKTVKIGGMAKGSGMIHPNMATMLSFLTTDAAISRELLQKALKESVDKTYNMISIDGDTSTNDTLLILANGCSGNEPIYSENEDFAIFKAALDFVNEKLAKDIVRDGEGATKFIEMRVEGAKTENDAKLLSRAVVSSNLVKTALFGDDANWGRILCAMGYSGGYFDPNKVELVFSSPTGEFVITPGSNEIMDEAKAREILKEREITITAKLADGTAGAIAWGSDLSYDYIRINGAYRT